MDIVLIIILILSVVGFAISWKSTPGYLHATIALIVLLKLLHVL